MTEFTRRRLLAGSGALAAATVAGCTDAGPGESDEPDQDGDAPIGAGGNESEATDGEGENQTEEDAQEEAVEDVNHADPDGSIEFVQPEDGDESSSPVQIEAAVEGFELASVEEDDVEDGTGHLHVIVDEGCIEPEYTIPQEEGYHHLSEGETEIELDLEPGEHDLCLQAGDGLHDAYDLTDEITIEVTDGGNESEEADDSDGGNGNESAEADDSDGADDETN
ncbi:DUF4399 domain-containing protein [Halopiger goleimassiliensis]|uniref:DUF4399 domain-containing protein n=1 Tax=Halopiger goleimassiliensis TaxID=1293048 RepID=UPI0009DBD12D|nr:DUF4399 domain-containing protein [Halopiger goleimassiliensis]